MSGRDKLAVLLLPKDWKKLEMVELKHPKSGKGQLFAFNENKTQIKEVISVTEPHGSWFIGDTIESDGRLQMLVDFDPILLIIPYLRASERPVPLDHLLNDDEFPHTECLVNFSSTMDKIANAKGSSDLNVWVWDEEKALNYLNSKIEKLTNEIISKRLTLLDNTSSTNYVSSNRSNESQDEEAKKYAWEFLSDFLQVDLSQKLAKKLQINLEVPSSANKLVKTASIGPKTVSNGPKEDFSKDFKSQKSSTTANMSTKQKALAKSSKEKKRVQSYISQDNILKSKRRRKNK